MPVPAYQVSSEGIPSGSLSQDHDQEAQKSRPGRSFLNGPKIVWVHDQLSPRFSRITSLLNQQGEFVVEKTGCLNPKHSSTEQSPIVLIAIEKEIESNSSAFGQISLFKQLGQMVIAYGEGVKNWEIKSKCAPLLAGAAKLLDSSAADFGEEIRKVLHLSFTAFQASSDRKENLRRAMIEAGIVGRSDAMLKVFELVSRFSQMSDLPVLITGETGTGKELLTKAIYKLDPKRNLHPYRVINCAAIQPELLESEFFGHKRGAFTGADRERQGLIRSADGGVLFLDEIGELEYKMQAKLLRTLQERSVRAVGEETEVGVSVRFIAATNRDLEKLVAEGKFRADLYHRLKVLVIRAPALRDRREDIRPLVDHFILKHSRLNQSVPLTAGDDFLQALEQVELSGNVRELENVVHQSIAHHGDQGELEISDLPLELLVQVMGERRQNGPDNIGRIQVGADELNQPSNKSREYILSEMMEKNGWNLPKAIQAFEKDVFDLALQRTSGNQSKAARLLGVTARTVYNKIRK